jgi:FkbM family methyltransferase
MDYVKHIENWDNKYCEKHVTEMCDNISQIFLSKNISTINYIDIGANVGKVYDILGKMVRINRAYLFEPSPILYKYLSEKFEQNPDVSTYHCAVYKEEKMISIDESFMISQMSQSEYNDLNLGMSTISSFDQGDIPAIPISKFLNENESLYDIINFIKIDTETVDLEILEDLLTVIDKFSVKPIIEFEKNYSRKGRTDDDCQAVLNLFFDHGYQNFDIKTSCTFCDGVLKPLHLV